MAKSDLETLTVRLEASLTQYEKQLAKATQVTTRELRRMHGEVQKGATKIESTLGSIGRNLGGIGAGFLGGLFTRATLTAMRTAISSIADIGDQADNLGLTTDEFQAISGAAKLAGVETEALAKGLKTLGVNTAEAARGQGDLGKLFEANGISIRDANGNLLSQQQILLKVADLVKNSASEQEKLSIAQIALGKSGVGLVNLLEQGAGGVAEAFAKASVSMGGFTAEQIEAARKIDDEFDILEKSLSVSLKGAFLDIAVVGEAAFLQISGGIDTAIEKGSALGKLLKGIKDLLPGFNITKENPLFSLSVGGKMLIGNEENNLPSTPGNTAGKGSLPTNVNSSGERATPTRQIQTQTDAVAKLIPKVIQLSAEEQHLNDLYEAQQALAMEVYDSKTELAQTALTAFEAIAIGGEKASDVIKDLAQNLLKAAVQASLFGSGPFASLFGTSGSGGIFGSLFGKPAGRAGGGHVNAGQPYIVGERRPEVFVPSQSGSIVPRVGGGGSNVQIIDQRRAGEPVQPQRGSDGTMRFFIRDAVNDIIGSGQANKSMRGQFGIAPQKARR